VIILTSYYLLVFRIVIASSKKTQNLMSARPVMERFTTIFLLGLVLVASNAVAQTSNYTQQQSQRLADYVQMHHAELEMLTNYARAHNITVREVLNNPKLYNDYETNAFFLIHGKTESEYYSNAESSVKSAKIWPEATQRNEIFERCAMKMRSSIDVDKINVICAKMATNLPSVREFKNKPVRDGATIVTFLTNDVVIDRLKGFSNLVKADLNSYTALLSSPDLESYIGPGYCAKISTRSNFFFWLFWPNNLVRSVEKRSADGQHVLTKVSFYENGLLAAFRVVSPPESLSFDANGRLISYCMIEDNMSIDLRLDEADNVVIRCFLIKGK
jgi:hypothetical protein